jgi:hypothetical protein
MNTEEKAIDLYNIFGKELAIKCVEEMLESMPTHYNVWKDDGGNFVNGYTYYWKQVKYYIEGMQ